MTDQKPGTGDADETPASEAGEQGRSVDEAVDSTEGASADEHETTDGTAAAEAGELASADATAPVDDDAGTDPAESAQAVAGASDGSDGDSAEPGATDDDAPDATDASAAAAGAAWTTTPVAPDPEATEAALAALAATPETPVEPPLPASPVQSMGEEPPEEGTPVLLVGGILVGAFIVALGIVLLLFRPFDSGEVIGTPSPSPFVTSSPSAQPTDDLSVDTPDFQGLSLEEAEAEAAANDLIVRINPIETDEADPDTVLDQDPPAGTVLLAGDTIELDVAVPLSSMPVPDPTGMNEDDFLAALDDSGLFPGERTEANDPDVPAGEIISTNPDAGTEVAQGSRVAYVVSTGPASVAVPDVIDTPEADALAALDDAGLVPGERTELNDEVIVAGNVISTDPAAAEEVAPDSGVAYVVSTGPASVAVPDVIDTPEADALAALDDAGLVPGERTELNDEVIVAGNVISTDPAAAEEVAPDSGVAYVVSTGPASVAVPDVIDTPEADALAALDDAGLVPGERTELNDEVIVAGNVISTDPAAAEEVAPDSGVAYVVSTGPASVAVPDVIDTPEADALAALDDAGLVPGERTELNDEVIVAGNVISTDPAAAEEVAPDSGVAYVVSTGPASVAVPDVIDTPEADALAALDDAGLVPGERTELNDEVIVAGNVISTDPAAAEEVAPDSGVAYVVSTGPASVAVPDVIDTPEADALAALDDAGLVPGERTELNDEVIVAGNVISTESAAGASVDIGSTVSYNVSLGVAQVEVPALDGGSAADAAAALDDAGLAGNATELNSDSVPAGEVFGQAPAAGASVDIGSTVSYNVSLGVAQVEVPALDGGSAADAAAALDDAGLAGNATELNSDSVPAGEVFGQAPAAGASVDIGSTVSYNVSLGVAQVEVPALDGGSAADAAAALDDAGLAGNATELNSDSVPAGEVFGQAPAAGASVDIGSTVSYNVSLGVAQVEVPALDGGSAADAAAALDDAGLAGNATELNSDSVPAGEVFGQAPAAGASVDIGSTVSYNVSLGVAQVEVPALDGGSAADAAAALDDAGLAGNATELNSDSVPAGEVFGQAPAAGASVDIGSTVSYNVSLGVAQVEVPALDGGSAADAAAALDDAGLAGNATELNSDSVPAGEVFGQAPAAGASVDIGSTVSYNVSLGVAQVEVPALDGGSAADAAAALDDAGLAGNATELNSDSVPAGEVFGQAPAAGASVDIGSTVSYNVSLGVAQVEVPALDGGSAADAAAALDDAGLAGNATELNSDSVPAGEVFGQAPAAGASVDIGSTVSYNVSLGVAQVEVPALDGGSAADAAAALDDAGLAGNATELNSDSVPAGEVFGQAPAAGASVDIGSTVSYNVSLGVAQVEVPALDGGSAADAAAALDDAGLAGNATELNSDSVPAGEVFGQAPAAGASVDIGSTVSYNVSLGVAQVEVPALDGGSAADAAAALDDAGLAGNATELNSDSVPAGEVFGQAPAAGASVDIGSTVSYNVSLGVAQVEVPALDGGSAADAAAALDDAGLAGNATELNSDSVPAGEVFGQAPAAGASVDIGSTVSYNVSLGVAQVEVPALDGGSAADAAAALDDAGLAGNATELNSDSVPAGEVFGQAPAAGASVDIGSTVSYNVSLGVAQVEVPALDGGSAADAAAALDDAGLAGNATELNSDSVPAGEVFGQAPAAGASVDIGSTVSYNVSLGVAQVEVPALDGGSAADAAAALDDAGLAGNATELNSDSVPAGEVFGQAPAAGASVDIGSTVSYNVSLGVAQVEVPALDGGSAADAAAALDDAGLAGNATELNSDSVPAGEVFGQAPAAGASVDIGSTVSYNVSLGVAQVEVPALDGGSAADAAAALDDAGLAGNATELNSDSVPAGEVFGQAPAAGASVDIGSTVSYNVSLGVAQVEVPALDGGSAADAAAALDDAGLAGNATELNSDSVPAGEVFGQAPAAGASVDIGSTVSYNVSLGVAQVEVPALDGGSAADAAAALDDAGLAGNATELNSDSVPAGEVFGQAPAAGASVDIGSTVSYNVSLGVAQVEVPALDGGSAADAAAALDDAGLAGNATELNSDSVPAGEVFGQAPAAGASVDIGSTVSYNVSLGVAPEEPVPNVRNESASDARAILEDAGFNVTEVLEQTSEDVAAGDAVKTDPAADEALPAGSDVALYVSTGSKFTTVPDVRGQPESEAAATLAGSGLDVSETRMQSHNNVAAGDAIKTAPAADEEVEIGSSVVLTVSTGPVQVEVPDIVGLKQGAAKNAITDAGLTVGTSDAITDASAKNTVLGQEPAAGTMVAEGTAVDYTRSSGPALVEVPEVRGLGEADATTAITAAGLVVDDTTSREHDDVAAGDAITSEPDAGEQVAPGTAVTLVLSSGPRQATVPDIVGLKQGAAKNAITDAGLTVGTPTTVEDDSPKNTVLGQEPAAGTTVAEGTAVDYTRSSGPTLVDVPDIIGLPEADATTAITGAGLVAGVRDDASDADIAAGDVSASAPSPGESVNLGSAVDYTVSTGPVQVEVPDIVGLKQGAAKNAITDAGLTVGTSDAITDASAKNTVLGQEPAAGTMVAEGTAVDYTRSSGPALVEVPEVRGLGEADATTAITAAGLVVDDTTSREHDDVAAGDAITSEPDAGEQVAPGTAVTLVLSSGPRQATVPDIVGLKQGAAKNAITDAGLTVGTPTTVEDDSPKNTVLGQEPAAGTTVAEGTAVDYTRSSGPTLVDVPAVKNLSEADATTAITGAGLVVSEVGSRQNNNIALGDAITTDPEPGTSVEVGTGVVLTLSAGPKQAIVPDIVGLKPGAADDALATAKLATGDVSEANDDVVQSGVIISQDPAVDTQVDEGTAVAYVVSLGPVIEPHGLGGSLTVDQVISQLDVVATETEAIRGLPLGNTPYDGTVTSDQEDLLSQRAFITRDAGSVAGEEAALKRLGLLPDDADLARMLDELYGQALRTNYLESRGRLSVLIPVEKLNAKQRGAATREFVRAMANQAVGLDASRVNDLRQGDRALSRLALEQGDGTAAMLEWSAATVNADNQTKIANGVVPGDRKILQSMPQILQREYDMPFLEGRAFVDKLRSDGGWAAVDAAWRDLPRSTEQIMHPGRYPSDRPVDVALDGVAGRLGGGWSEDWQQTMGELRIGVWLADGASGTQDGPTAPIKLPKAGAANGWGGDRLISLDGPDGSWAIVWQTAWDSVDDAVQFADAAVGVMSDLPGSNAVLQRDIAGGMPAPVLVLVASDADTLASVQASLGVDG